MQPSAQPIAQPAPPTAAQPEPQVGRIRRGWLLTKSSWHVLRLDKELTALSCISFFVALIGLIPIGLIVWKTTTIIDSSTRAIPTNDPIYQTSLQPWEQFLLAFLAYFITTLVANFFGGAVIYGATQRFRGGDPTLSTSIAGARRKISPLILFSLMMTTVGLFFQFLEDRLPFAGALAARLFDAAWTIANIFAVPVIVLSDKNVQPLEATKQSVQVIKKVWGEGIVANIGIGFIALFSYIVYVLVFVLAGTAAYGLGGSGENFAPLAIVTGLGLIGLVGLILVFTTLSSIAKAALYHYAITGTAPGPYDKDLLRTSMTPKKARKVFG
mgnify:CR=1 FL=1